MGYQTFLYSSEHDTRRLLLFLVEKLPRDEGERGAEPPGTCWGGDFGEPQKFLEGSHPSPTSLSPPNPSSAGKSGALLRAIGAQIREQLGTPWVPPLCRTPRLQRLQVNFGGGPAAPPELEEAPPLNWGGAN